MAMTAGGGGRPEAYDLLVCRERERLPREGYLSKKVQKISPSRMCGNGRVIYSHCIRSSGNGISVPPPSNNNPTSDQSKGIWTKVASVAKKGVDGFKSDMKREICCGLRDEFKGEIQGLKDDISKLRDDIYHIKVDVMELKLKNQMQSMMRDIKADVMELKLKNQMQPMMRDLRADVMKLKTEVGQNKMVQNQMVKKMISPCQTGLLGSFIKLVMWVLGM